VVSSSTDPLHYNDSGAPPIHERSPRGSPKTGYPASVAIDPAGSLLIADPFNASVWKVDGIAAPGLIAGQPIPKRPGASTASSPARRFRRR